jgi:small subunit ribosomal protein S1
MQDLRFADLVTKLTNDFNHSNINNIGKVVTGIIKGENNDFFFIDVGLKSYGKIEKKDLPHKEGGYQTGESVNLYLIGFDKGGNVVCLSSLKANRIEAIKDIQAALDSGVNIYGRFFHKKSDNCLFDLRTENGSYSGIIGVLSRINQVSSDFEIGREYELKVLSVSLNNFVASVSEKDALEKKQRELRYNFIQAHKEGDVITGNVVYFDNIRGVTLQKDEMNIYIPMSDISWNQDVNINYVVGQEVQCKILKLNPSTHQIIASIKHLEEDPWKKSVAKYSINELVKVKVDSISTHGYLCSLDDNKELIGLLHSSELSWDDENISITEGQSLEAMIYDIDAEKRKISLSLRRIKHDPWNEFIKSHNVGDVVTDLKISNKNRHGIFVDIAKEAHCLIRPDEVSYGNMVSDVIANKFNVGDLLPKVVYLGFDENRRINFSLKQVKKDPYVEFADLIKEGEVVDCRIAIIKPDSIIAEIICKNVSTEIYGYVAKSELFNKVNSKSNIAVNDVIKMQIISFNKDGSLLKFSIKGADSSERQKNMEKYNGKGLRGASIAELLQNAIKEEN